MTDAGAYHVSQADLDVEYLPPYGCESCGADVPSPGLCDACEIALEQFIAAADDPRRV